MNNRARALAAINHQPTDKTPYSIHFTQAAHDKMAEYYSDPDFASKLGNCLEIHTIGGAGGFREVKPNIFRDPFGVAWDRTYDKDIGVIHNRLITPENVEDFPFPEVIDLSDRSGEIQQTVDSGEKVVVGNLGFSLFERAWTLAGMETILMSMAAEPDFVNRLLDRIVELNLRAVNAACRAPIDAVMFGDDWGQQSGLLMGPAAWREFIKPRVRRMYQRVKEHGKYVFIHSCGHVQEVFPDLIECGLDVFNPFQPEVMPPEEMKEQYGGRLAFYGGISTQRTLPYGTPEEIREEVRRLVEVVGAGGGYIASPAHDIPADAKAENIAAMIETLQNQ